MSKGANVVVNVCSEVKANESVLIVTEPKMRTIADALAAATYSVGAEPVVMCMVPRKNDGEEPPELVSSAMLKSNVFFAAVNKSITHTSAVRNAVMNGSRGIMLTQFTEEMMISGGIEADFKGIAPTCKAIAEKLAGAKKIHLTTTFGTDLTMSAVGRRGNAMTCIVGPGEFSPIPNIEANVSPVEGSAEGKIVVDASIPYEGIGIIQEPIHVEVEKGMIKNIRGGQQADLLAQNLATKKDKMVYNIAELGVGLNPKCRFTGIMLEDEGVFGSVHIGIGTNITLGGNVKAACHYDLIMTGVTLMADEVKIIDNGEICL